MRLDDPPGLPAQPGRSVIYLAASLLLVAGLALLVTGHWWSRPVIGFFEGFPGGRWLSLPVPYLPLIAVAIGARLLARFAARAR